MVYTLKNRFGNIFFLFLNDPSLKEKYGRNIINQCKKFSMIYILKNHFGNIFLLFLNDPGQ